MRQGRGFNLAQNICYKRGNVHFPQLVAFFGLSKPCLSVYLTTIINVFALHIFKCSS